MSMKRPPLPVVVVSLLYLLVGLAGFIYHFHTLLAWQKDSVWVELTELLAVIAGFFLLRGQNWARWLAIAWMAFHVALSAFHSYAQVAVHAAFLMLIAWALFVPAARRYFGSPEQTSDRRDETA
jgi:hypothetical protein